MSWSINVLRASLALAGLLAVTGCAPYGLGANALISGNTPPAANSQGSEPQPPNSLPPGAEGMGFGPNARSPNFGAIVTPVPFL